MKTNWILLGGIWGFLGVALGAFGAHGLEKVLAEGEGLDWWRTAVFYQLVHAPVLVLLAVLPLRTRARNRAGWAFLLGSLVFSGTLYAMALGAPRWFGAITPVGGVGLLLGWLLLALSARDARPV